MKPHEVTTKKHKNKTIINQDELSVLIHLLHQSLVTESPNCTLFATILHCKGYFAYLVTWNSLPPFVGQCTCLLATSSQTSFLAIPIIIYYMQYSYAHTCVMTSLLLKISKLNISSRVTYRFPVGSKCPWHFHRITQSALVKIAESWRL